jgi:tRNA modification GTPase
MKSSFLEDTIVAPISANGIGAVSLIRISGKNSFSIISKIFQGSDIFSKKSHSIFLGHIVDQNKIIDEVLISIFIGKSSFTKEDSIEISCHGSPLIVKKIVSLCIQNGARVSLPGEFSKRAFLNGRYDLAQAEAIADLINSDSEIFHEFAIKNFKGEFSNSLKSFRDKILERASLLEVELDFSEENQLAIDRFEFKSLFIDLKNHIENLLNSFESGKAFRDGISTAIIGKPNAGKSTILNAILKEDRAIVCEIAGTTRDILSEFIFLNGFKFRIVDTAGIRENPENKIEKIGIEKTKIEIKTADIILFIFDISDENFEKDLFEIENLYKNTKSKIIKCANKIDLLDEKEIEKLKKNDFIFLSAKNNIGIDKIEEALIDFTKNYDSSKIVLTNMRHFEILTKIKEVTIICVEMIEKNISSEFLMQQIREILNYIGQITGQIVTDNILEEIFSKFCIGK